MVQVSPQKYFFDNNDFDEEALRRKREALRKPTFSQEEMEASRQTGFAQGRQEGQRETMASLEARLSELLQQISHTAAIFLDNETARLSAFIDQSSLVTAQILIKVMPVLLQTLSLEQIENFVRETLRQHVKKGSLTILVAPEYADAVRDRLKNLPETTPHLGEWSIEADPSLSNYQSRVEWNGGGAEWNPENVATVALQTLFDHLPDHLKEQAVPKAPAVPGTTETAPVSMDEPVQTDNTNVGDPS